MDKSLLYNMLLRPIYTEKATILSDCDKGAKYVFAAAPEATKSMITRAIKHVFSVDVESVNIINVKPKQKVFKGRRGNRSGYKKAVVTLRGDQKIDVVSGVV